MTVVCLGASACGSGISTEACEETSGISAGWGLNAPFRNTAAADDFIGGHDIPALERFPDEARRMIVFDILLWKPPVGEKGGEIKIRKHAAFIEGHILFE